MSTFFKQIYRYTRPRAYRHNENIWPYVKIDRAVSGEISRIRYKGKIYPIEPLSLLQDSFCGSVLLTATGPSINSSDFSLVPSDLPVMGVNGAYCLHKQVSFSLYVIVDMNFFDTRSDIIREIIQDKNVLLFIPVYGIMRIINEYNDVKCRIALIEDANYRIYQKKIDKAETRSFYKDNPNICFYKDTQSVGFSKDIRNGIFEGATVVYWAFQILYFLGFEKILIAGLDMSNFHLPRFYENEDNKQPSFLETEVDSIVIPSFSHASQIFKDKKISVINLSIKSAIPDFIFDKVDFNEYFKR